ncbi:PLDc N-terminal domain-containing protein [Modestobacter sp. NPDC049651]|uniref:PLDc N-terminal domain-containing protein n=1 Tax=unclassified Modestobacter TaxID=2643866 RepID=UPI0033FF92F6
MARQKTSWSELTRAQRSAIVVGGAAELAMTAAALTDLARRPAGQVRGRKVLWALGCVVQPFGPLAYAAFGRR